MQDDGLYAAASARSIAVSATDRAQIAGGAQSPVNKLLS
jgi:hypothetical protein